MLFTRVESEVRTLEVHTPSCLQIALFAQWSCRDNVIQSSIQAIEYVPYSANCGGRSAYSTEHYGLCLKSSGLVSIDLSQQKSRAASLCRTGWLMIFNHAEILALLYRKSKQGMNKALKPAWLNVLDIITAALVASACAISASEEPTKQTSSQSEVTSIDPWRLAIVGLMAFSGGLHVVFGIFTWIDDKELATPWRKCYI
ncbi:hypothetical protein SCAR479_07601 [Seiridium cardinale]|uniref:Uncharacterized protein n=1 Tax=Seiridium cardinale TaxID=138064 RepID=A0ABR2XPR9_9PEZI